MQKVIKYIYNNKYYFGINKIFEDLYNVYIRNKVDKIRKFIQFYKIYRQN